MKKLTKLLILSAAFVLPFCANAQYNSQPENATYQPVVYTHFNNPGNEFTQGAVTGNVYTRDIATQETARENVLPQSGEVNESTNIYPNPATSSTNVTLSQPASNKVSVDIYDLNGTLQTGLRILPAPKR